MRTPALSATGISKAFGHVVALRDVSLQLNAGEVHALLGENGAGKSTLLRILGGQHRPDAGRLSVEGHDVELVSPKAAHDVGVRVVAQEPEIIPHVTVAENIYVGALPHHGHRYDRRLLLDRARDDIARYGFADVLDAQVPGSSLSPAQRQLVEILRALRPGAKVIAFDEPTSSLAGNEVTALFALIDRLRVAGVAILYVSHRMHEILSLADRMTVLRDGALVGTKVAADVTEAELIRMMVGRDLDSMFVRQRAVRGEVVLRAEHLVNEDLHDVSLSVHAGEVVALAGLVGSGRTELAKALAGDTRLDSGEIWINGEPLKARSPSDAIAAGIGLAPEERKTEALFMDRSVRDNASLAALPALTRMRFVRRRAERALVDTYMTSLNVRAASADALIATLSGGNQQKVVLARWLATGPTVLILDEPTRGVDVGAKADIYRIIGDLTDKGMAVLMISSELPEVIGLADRIVVMAGGRVAGHLDGPSATEEEIVRLALQDSAVPIPEGDR